MQSILPHFTIRKLRLKAFESIAQGPLASVVELVFKSKAFRP